MHAGSRLIDRLGVSGSILVLGVCSELIYLFFFVVRFPLLSTYNVNRLFIEFVRTDSALAAIVGAFVALFALYGAAWWLMQRRPDQKSLGQILSLGGLFGGTMAFVYPITAPDIYKYVAAGRILLIYHRNPMLTPPAAIPNDPIMVLTSGLRFTGAPYGPFGILVDSAPSLLTGGNLLPTLLLLKLMFCACVLADAYLAYRIAARFSPVHAPGAALLVAWNPLVIFQTGSGGHNDVAMLLLALLGVLAVVEGQLIRGPVLVMASALVKFGTLPLIPLFVAHGLAHQMTAARKLRYAATVTGALLILVILAYAPFWAGVDTFRRSLMEEQAYQYSFSRVVHVLSSGTSIESNSPEAFFGRLLFLPVLGWALWLATRGSEELVRGSALVLLAFLMLAASSFRPWYATWPFMLGAASPRTIDRLAGVILTFGAAIGGLFHAYGYDLTVFQTVGTPDVLPYVITFGPPALLLAGFALFRIVPSARAYG